MIYLVERTDKWSYDDHDAFVCFANSVDEARHLNPDGYRPYREGEVYYGSWTSPDNVKVTELVHETEPRIILSSFNAG